MDYIIIFVAVVIAWLFGMVWYHPKVLGTIRSKGYSEELCGPPGPLGLALSFLQLLAIGFASHYLAELSYTPHEFWCVMGLVAVSFFLGICAGGHMEGKGKNTYLIDAGYVFTCVIIVAGIVFYTPLFW